MLLNPNQLFFCDRQNIMLVGICALGQQYCIFLFIATTRTLHFYAAKIFSAASLSFENIFSSIPPKGFNPITFSFSRKESIPIALNFSWATLASTISLNIERTIV